MTRWVADKTDFRFGPRNMTSKFLGPIKWNERSHIQILIYYSTFVQTNVSQLHSFRDQSRDAEKTRWNTDCAPIYRWPSQLVWSNSSALALCLSQTALVCVMLWLALMILHAGNVGYLHICRTRKCVYMCVCVCVCVCVSVIMMIAFVIFNVGWYPWLWVPM